MISCPDSEQSRKAFFKNLKRKDYVQKAAEIIENEGMDACSIRRLSKELGCSSTALYRHFENLDELRFYAQLSNLNTYIANLGSRIGQWTSPWEMHLGIWELYADQAFRKPDAFDLIFYRNIDRDLGTAMQEYYEMFPEAIIHMPPYLVQMLETPGFYERDYLILQTFVDQGILTENLAKKINHIECTLFLGYFKYVLDARISEEEIPMIVAEFIGEIREIISMYTGKAC